MAKRKQYEIWMRNYPQPDVNITEEWELSLMTLNEAKAFIDQLETNYTDDGWKGHRMYKAKFYPQEVQ